MINRPFSLQRFKGTESISKVSEQVKNVKLNEDKPKETKSEETLDEVCIECILTWFRMWIWEKVFALQHWLL